MSEENRPNLHAVGLVIDIYDALAKRVRGEAGKPENYSTVMNVTKDLIVTFVNEVDAVLDKEFPNDKELPHA